MLIQPIKPSRCLFIKLGKGGGWEEECIQNGTLRLGFRDAPHDLCLQGKWDAVHEIMLKHENGKLITATQATNQIKLFYEADETVLWVTLYGDHLYWCFSQPQITVLGDKTKIRPVIEKWWATNIKGEYLRTSQLSGKLLRVQRFQGTIFNILESEYLIRKINGDKPLQVEKIQQARETLEALIEPIISDLHWKDFEVLVDLIFSQSGWQRESILGESEKTLDLRLLEPITDTRYGVQVKSQAGLKELNQFIESSKSMMGFARFYFVVHSPEHDLPQKSPDSRIELWGRRDVARLVVKHGLIDWLTGKVS